MSGSNNLIFGGTGSTGDATATVTADPLLVAPAAADFHLGAGSPAIDTGVDTDANDNPRRSAPASRSVRTSTRHNGR